MKSCTIPDTKPGVHKHTLLWMKDKDLVLSIKECNKKMGESKFLLLKFAN